MGARDDMPLDPYAKFVLYLLATLIVLGLGVTIGLKFCQATEDNDKSVAATSETAFQCRSVNFSVNVCRDSDTGCEYIRTSRGITPRLRADGTPWCGGALAPGGVE